MNIIEAKFKSKCAETGTEIPKGETCLHDPVERRVYAIGSQRYKDFQDQKTDDAKLVEAQENEYFDKFVRDNNINSD